MASEYAHLPYGRIVLKHKVKAAKDLRILLDKFLREASYAYLAGGQPNYNAHKVAVSSILESYSQLVIRGVFLHTLGSIKKLTNKNEQYIETRIEDLVHTYIATRIANRVKLITNTTKLLIRRAVTSSIAEGLGVSEAAERILGISLINPRRAEVIARTEIGSAASYGNLASGKYAQDELGVKMAKEWVATLDTRTRDTHAYMDGVKIPIEENFNISGYMADRPHADGLPASEKVNCRCGLVFMPLEF